MLPGWLWDAWVVVGSLRKRCCAGFAAVPHMQSTTLFSFWRPGESSGTLRSAALRQGHPVTDTSLPNAKASLSSATGLPQLKGIVPTEALRLELNTSSVCCVGVCSSSSEASAAGGPSHHPSCERVFDGMREAVDNSSSSINYSNNDGDVFDGPGADARLAFVLGQKENGPVSALHASALPSATGSNSSAAASTLPSRATSTGKVHPFFARFVCAGRRNGTSLPDNLSAGSSTQSSARSVSSSAASECPTPDAVIDIDGDEESSNLVADTVHDRSVDRNKAADVMLRCADFRLERAPGQLSTTHRFKTPSSMAGTAVNGGTGSNGFVAGHGKGSLPGAAGAFCPPSDSERSCCRQPLSMMGGDRSAVVRGIDPLPAFSVGHGRIASRSTACSHPARSPWPGAGFDPDGCSHPVLLKSPAAAALYPADFSAPQDKKRNSLRVLAETSTAALSADKTHIRQCVAFAEDWGIKMPVDQLADLCQRTMDRFCMQHSQLPFDALFRPELVRDMLLATKTKNQLELLFPELFTTRTIKAEEFFERLADSLDTGVGTDMGDADWRAFVDAEGSTDEEDSSGDEFDPGASSSKRRRTASLAQAGDAGGSRRRDKRGAARKRNLKNIFVLSGPASTGKSAFVYAFAAQTRQTVLEVNTANRRSGACVKALFAEAAQSHSSSASKNLVFFDDADILFDDDKGFYATVEAMCSSSKRPIFIACRDVPGSLAGAGVHIRFYPTDPDVCSAYMSFLLQSVGLRIEMPFLRHFLRYCPSMRQCWLLLQVWWSSLHAREDLLQCSSALACAMDTDGPLSVVSRELLTFCFGEQRFQQIPADFKCRLLLPTAGDVLLNPAPSHVRGNVTDASAAARCNAQQQMEALIRHLSRYDHVGLAELLDEFVGERKSAATSPSLSKAEPIHTFPLLRLSDRNPSSALISADGTTERLSLGHRRLNDGTLFMKFVHRLRKPQESYNLRRRR